MKWFRLLKALLRGLLRPSNPTFDQLTGELGLGLTPIRVRFDRRVNLPGGYFGYELGEPVVYAVHPGDVFVGYDDERFFVGRLVLDTQDRLAFEEDGYSAPMR